MQDLFRVAILYYEVYTIALTLFSKSQMCGDICPLIQTNG